MPLQKKKKSRLRRLLEYDVSLASYKQILFENLVLMISSGINIVTALMEFKAESKIKALDETLDGMIDEIRNGQPFWQTLKNYKIIKGNMLDVIRIGEESGNLEANLETVLLQQRKDKEIRSKLQTAGLYPAIVLTVLAVVGSAILVFVLPRLTEVYASFNTELPWITKMMIQLGAFMGKYGQIFVPSVLAVIALIAFFLFINPKTKWIGQKITLTIPILKTAMMQLEMTRFGYLMNSLQSSGFKIVDSMDIIVQATEIYEYKKMYQFFADSLSNGDSFAQSFERYKSSRRLLPIYVRQAIISGEQTGKLKESFKAIGDAFQKEYDYTTANLYVLMEPILLIIVWIGVSVMAVAVILPIYSLIGNFSSLTESPGSSTSNSSVSVTKSVLPQVELISDGVQTIPIYAAKGGVIIYNANHGERFEYRGKDPTWYDIVMKDGSVGWVEQRFVKEIQTVSPTTLVK
jgi:type IV pilus assembly protein PilC